MLSFACKPITKIFTIVSAILFTIVVFLFFQNEASAAITYQTPGGIAYSTAGGTTISPAYPASVLANDLLVLIIGMKPSTANSGSVTTPTGWTADGSLVGGGGYGTTLGNNTGNTNIFAFYKVAVGGESGTLAVTIATNDVSWAQMYRFSNATGAWSMAGATGQDITGNSAVSIAMTTNPGVTSGDYILGAMVIPTNVGGGAQFSAEALAQTSITFATPVEISEPSSSTGANIGGVTYRASVAAGTASASPTFTATAGGTVTNVRGPGIFIRIREANTAPTLSISQPDGMGDSVTAGDLYNITYSLSDPDPFHTATSAFYYDTDAVGLNGTAIYGACATSPEGTNATCSWNTTGVTPGSYYVYGLTSDGIAEQTSAYSPGMITINAPIITFTITATAGANGSIVPLGAIVVADSSSQAFNINPDPGFYTATLLVDGGLVSTSSPYTFTNVTADHTISATFALIPPPPGSFTIIANQNPNGTVSPSGSTVVTEGNSQMYTITPDAGYDVGSLIIDSSPLLSTSTTYTFNSVSADHTIEATFVALPGTEPVLAVTRRLASIIFSGKAFPDGKISIVQKNLAGETETAQQGTTDGNGFFNFRFGDITSGAYSFGLLIKDPEGRISQTKFYQVDLSMGDEVFKNIVTPPTIDILNGQVSRGGTVKIFGYASPGHTIRVYLNDILNKEALAGRGGVYSFDLQTGELPFGQYKVRAKQINLDGGVESDFSTSRTFIVSKLAVVKADFSGDGKIDIKDWSIFLSRFTSKDKDTKKSVDLSGDGKVDISDFSIFIKTLRKK